MATKGLYAKLKGPFIMAPNLAASSGGAGESTILINQASQMTSNIEANRITHIMQSRHAWNLIDASNWESVSDAIQTALIRGTGAVNHAGNVIYSYVIRGQTVEVTTRIVDNATRIVDAWVRTR